MLKNISKAVILAGGKGTRLSEQTKQIPKPLVKVGPYPIIIHIMRRLQSAGVKEFYIISLRGVWMGFKKINLQI